MATRIDIIAEGYANKIELYEGINERSEFMKATGSCCLVHSDGQRILFDTMGPWERDLLINGLEQKFKIHTDDINLLVCSHSHPDHIGNINLFTEAYKHFIGTSVYTKDVYDLNHFKPIGSYTYKSKRDHETEVVQYKNYQIDSNVSIEPTQGHTLECVSLIINNCDQYGSVGLVGDLFERSEDVNDESIWLRAGSQNPDLQRANRAFVYNKVDYILPGHGPLFKTMGPIKF